MWRGHHTAHFCDTDDRSTRRGIFLGCARQAALERIDFVTRFRNEVRVARQVSHPNVCRVYDLGEVDAQMFLSLEYVDGEDLGSLLRRIGRLPGNALRGKPVAFSLIGPLRNQWVAGAVFALIFAAPSFLGNTHPVLHGIADLLLLAIYALVVLRWGLLALAVGVFVGGVLSVAPITLRPSAWYFGSMVFMLGTVVVIAAWAFHTSIAGQRLWKPDLFE